MLLMPPSLSEWLPEDHLGETAIRIIAPTPVKSRRDDDIDDDTAGDARPLVLFKVRITLRRESL
jgi:hypothetical protein